VLADVFRMLVLTYPRYIDFHSRTAAEHTLVALLNANPDLRTKIVQWLARESERIVAAAECVTPSASSDPPTDSPDPVQLHQATSTICCAGSARLTHMLFRHRACRL